MHEGAVINFCDLPNFIIIVITMTTSLCHLIFSVCQLPSLCDAAMTHKDR